MKVRAVFMSASLLPTLALAQNPWGNPWAHEYGQSKYNTIVNLRDGHALTRVANDSGNYLKLYDPYEFRQENGVRQNYVLFDHADGVQLVYSPDGACVTQYESKWIIDSGCTKHPSNMWIFLPTSTGAVQLMNQETGLCMSNQSPDASNSYPSLVTCVGPGGSVNADQLWTISPPRGFATAM
ncbi:MAG: hypothetical protein JNN30_04645 [Rhodanobacteraceae bacterium]|nr:hypothetical protein [Rhodanobacteraceae bacterium]